MIFLLSICSVAQLCLTLCNPMDCSMPGFPVHHQLPQLAQTHVHRVSNAITISSSVTPSPPAFSLSQHQGLFQWVTSLHQVAKVLEFSFSISPSIEYSGLISFRMNWLDLLAVPGILKSLLQQHSSETLVLCRSWSVLCSLFLKESVTAGIKVAAIWFDIKTHVWRENRRSERLDKDFRGKVARRATLSPLNPSYTHTLTHMHSPGAWRIMKC